MNINCYSYKDFAENCLEFSKITSEIPNFKWRMCENHTSLSV